MPPKTKTYYHDMIVQKQLNARLLRQLEVARNALRRLENLDGWPVAPGHIVAIVDDAFKRMEKIP